ncbi:YveK family protein [Hutsoniella sourekii]
MQEEVSLLEIFQMLRKHLGAIIGTTLIAGAIGVLVAMFLVSNKYSSQAQLLVNQQSAAPATRNNMPDQQIQYNDIQTNVALINTYSDMIKSDSVLNEVSQQVEGNISLADLKGAISVEQEPNSQAFNVEAVTTSPTLSQQVVESVIQVFEETLTEVYGEDISSIYVLSPATFNENPVSPNRILYGLIGAVLGAGLSLMIALFREMSDTTVRDSDFIQTLGLVNLGEIYALTKSEVRDNRMANNMSRADNKRRI